MNDLFLTIENGNLVLDNGRDERIAHGVEEVRTVLESFVGDVMCSSSIDFPEESTTDAETIAFCREFRGA